MAVPIAAHVFRVDELQALQRCPLLNILDRKVVNPLLSEQQIMGAVSQGEPAGRVAHVFVEQQAAWLHMGSRLTQDFKLRVLRYVVEKVNQGNHVELSKWPWSRCVQYLKV